jgi:hypothetical protein
MRTTAKYLLGAAAAAVIAVGAAAAFVIATYGIRPSSVTRPPDSTPFAGEPAKLLEVGTARHGDTRLSPIGRSCNTCHLDEDSYKATFNEPYAHYVRSVRWKTGLSKITAEGMVQFCMVSAMEGKPLPWDSETLAALTAFVLERHRKASGRTSAADQTIGGTCGAPPG